MSEHSCTPRVGGPEPKHVCYCEIGRDHTAAEHKRRMRERDLKPQDSSKGASNE